MSQGQTLETDETHLSVPPVSNKITKVIQESYHEEAVNKEKGKNYQSCMNAARQAGSEIIPFLYERWQSELCLIVD